jgi:hypothetical protein
MENIGNEKFDHEFYKVFENAEATKERDWQKVKEELDKTDGYPNTPEMDLILRIVSQWGNAVEMAKMEEWLKEYAKRQVPEYHTRKEDHNKEWESFWKEHVCNPDGTINLEQLKKELYDFSFVMEQVPKVYCHITGGKLSKVMYPAKTVISVADEYFKEKLEALTESSTTAFIPCHEDDTRACGSYTSTDGQCVGYVREAKVPVEGAVWVRASEFKYEVGMSYHAKDSKSKGAGAFDDFGNFFWGDHSFTPGDSQDDLYILDETK